MFRYVKGRVEEIFSDRVVIENQGIGYDVMISSFTSSELRIGEVKKIYTRFIVKEDGIQLIGFLEQTELELFHRLIGVSKVGPKLALAILSAYRPQEVIGMILASDILSLSKISGLGKKTSERIVLELRDQFKDFQMDIAKTPRRPVGVSSIKEEVIEGLASLGFSKKESEEAVKLAMEHDETDLEGILKYSLMLLQKS